MPRKPKHDYDIKIIEKLSSTYSLAKIAIMNGWNPKSTQSWIKRNFDVIKILHFIPKKTPKKHLKNQLKGIKMQATKTPSFLNKKDTIILLGIINIAEELKQFYSYYDKTYGENEIKEADDLHTRLTRELK